MSYWCEKTFWTQRQKNVRCQLPASHVAAGAPHRAGNVFCSLGAELANKPKTHIFSSNNRPLCGAEGFVYYSSSIPNTTCPQCKEIRHAQAQASAQ